MINETKIKRGAGRPTRDGAAAVGHIHIRTTLERKGAYVRAARPMKLAEWMTAELDRASGYSTNNEKGKL